MLNFTTQWKEDNIAVFLEKGFLLSFFTKMFFKKWCFSERRKTNASIYVKLGTNEEEIKGKLFNYSRQIKQGQIVTSINSINVSRAFIRSVYKLIANKAKVVGVPELYMAIIRTTVIDPIEYYYYLKGWSLVHANVFQLNGKTCVIAAGSKVGKSTLIKQLHSSFKINVLSDNYCFIKGDKVKTVEEPLRSGPPLRNKITFYNRSISGYPERFEGEVDYFFILKRTDKDNEISNLDDLVFSSEIEKIDRKDREGIFYLNTNDPIYVSTKKKLLLSGSYDKNLLTMKNGTDNVDKVIHLLINKIK